MKPFISDPATNQTQPRSRRSRRSAWLLEKVAQGCLALTGLVLASCACCQKCNHSGGSSGSGCCADHGAKHTDPKGGPGHPVSGPASAASDKRKAKADAPNAPATREESLWARPTPPRWR